MSDTTTRRSTDTDLSDSQILYLLYRRVDTITSILKVWFGLTLLAAALVFFVFVSASTATTP